MKKFFLALLLACTFFCAPARGNDFLEKVALYIPNRLIDALDLFSFSLGVGPVIEARLMGTRFVDVGAGASLFCYKFYKNYNRQYGLGVEEGWYWSFIFVGEERYSMLSSTSLVDKYAEDRAGIPDPTTRTYDFFEGSRDYWAIGGALGFLVDGDLYVHPMEWVDFALGFLTIDIKGDDLVFDDFR